MDSPRDVPPCAALPDAFALDADWPRDAFERRLSAGDYAPEGWVWIRTCNRCGQVWRIDIGDGRELDFAIKQKTAPWTADQDRHARLDYLRRSWGGVGEEECIWAGCTNLVLTGLAICAEHAYESGLRAGPKGS